LITVGYPSDHFYARHTPRRHYDDGLTQNNLVCIKPGAKSKSRGNAPHLVFIDFAVSNPLESPEARRGYETNFDYECPENIQDLTILLEQYTEISEKVIDKKGWRRKATNTT